MKKSIAIIIFLFFLGFGAKVYAETNMDQTNNNNDVNIGKTEHINSELNEAQAYKLLYENQKESNQKILSTIYWALGIILTTSIALIGGNIFNNYRINNDKIKNIELDLDGKFEELKKSHISEIQQKLSDNVELVKKQNKEILNDYKKQIKLEINTQNTTIEKTKKDLKSLSTWAKICVNNLEAEDWKNKGVYPNVLTNYIRAGELEIESGADVEHTLKNILDSLKNSRVIYSSDSSDLFELMKKVPEKHSNLLENIRNFMSSLPIN